MAEHPYKKLPDIAYWKRSVASIPYNEVDPVSNFTLKINKETKVATAGSCFAQHIARHLRANGFNYYVVEQGHPIIARQISEKYHYEMFSARFGNIYTARQLLQLMQRAYHEFSPVEDYWHEADGTFLDPFRPTVQPGGYISLDEMRADRKQHLAAVKKMFESLDVFIFTLGLTECWMSTLDGAVYPVCPGVSGGTFNADKHRFYNQDVGDVIADMSSVIDLLFGVNSKAEVILTVSPVPLMATAEKHNHVLSATTYSKSVLRVAADMLRRKYSNVHYFPSYEIITGAFSRGRYYTSDLRNITEEGVSHVMRTFLNNVTEGEYFENSRNQPELKDDFLADVDNFIEVECDEAGLDK